MRIDSPLMTNAIVTGSFSGSFTGAFDGDITADSVAYANITGKPTLISSSAQVVALVEAGTDSNTFTDADHTKLNGIETSATADQTGAEIKTALFAESDTNNLTDTLLSKLNGIEASADVTDATNVAAAGALMDSEVTNLAEVKAFDSSDYATAAQGALADSAQQPPSEGAFANGDKTKLDGIEASADVTDATNVTAAGALMDSELTSIADVKALDQSVISGASPTFGTANFTDATNKRLMTDAQETKLDSVESSADVTDTANVTSAGALMDSECTSLADVKALDQSVVSGASPTFGTANMTDATNKRFMTDAQETKLDSVETNADVTDTTNVTAAGALMDSELTNLAAVKAINQGLATGNDVQFNDLTLAGDLTVNGTTVSINATNLEVTDKLIAINQGGSDAASANGAGLFISGANESITWDNGNSRFTFSDDLNVGGNLTLTGTVDGRDVASDGTKLDGIESSATADQTDAEIRAAVEAATDSNVFTDADHTKLNGIEAGADVTDATNVKANLPSGVISGSAQITGVVITADSADTSRRMVFTESDDATDTNAQLFKDSAANFFYNPSSNTLSVVNIAASGNVDGRDVSADGTKLDGIEANATADQTQADINGLLITEVGTITTGTWNGTAIADAYLSSNTAHLSGTQTFSGAKTFSSAVTVSNNTASTSKTTGAVKVTGGVGIQGDVFAGGDVVAYASSDERLKDNVAEISNALDKVEKLRGVSFDWNDKQSVYSGHDIGVIAQDVEEVLPELVENRDNGYKAVKYDKLTAVLIQAVKELSAKVKELENK